MFNNPAFRFVLFFFLSYGLITAVVKIPALNSMKNATLRSISSGWLSTTLGGDLKFGTKAQKENGRLQDNVMVVDFEWSQNKIDKVIAEARRTGQSDIQVPYRFITYLLFEFFIVPMIFILSLIIATPMELRKKLIFGGLAYLVMFVFLLVKLLLLTLFSISKAQIDVYELSHGSMSVLQTLASVMTMGFSVIVAFFIWLILVFPKSALLGHITQWFEKRLSA